MIEHRIEAVHKNPRDYGRRGGGASGFCRAIIVVAAISTTAAAQPAPHAPERLTTDDYARAEQFLNWNVNRLVYGVPESPEWLEDDRLWYRNPIQEGHEFIIVDPEQRTRERAFDHEWLAQVLSEAADTVYHPFELPVARLRPTDDGRGLGFELDRRRWECDVIDNVCERPATPAERARDAVQSPDGRTEAFIRDHNLWLRDLATLQETQLTEDGEARYGYATDNEGWRRSDRPALVWSPDSRKIATFRLDERGVEEIHLLEMTDTRPALHSWPYAVPGDTIVPLYEWLVIHLDDLRAVWLDVEPDHQRTSSCCGRLRGDTVGDFEWSADGQRLAFVSTSRNYSHVRLRIADPESGEVREVLGERAEPFFESNAGGRGVPNWRVLHDRDEVLWYSQRTGWGHLYLYDLNSGDLKNRITAGDWNVIDVLHVDEANASVYFTAVGLEEHRDPYHRHFYRVGLNGANLSLLTPEDGDHIVSVSPTGRWFVDSYSRVNTPHVTVLRATDGNDNLTLEEADVSQLLQTGWPEPMPFTVKARDGETDLYGVMYRPSGFDANRRYPIINHIYPGPQAGSVGPRTFSAARRGNVQALAELGFIVVQIDALGTPMRSRDFHAFYYGDMGDNGLEDQIAGMRELAERHDWIDIERAGMYGHSGGGFATAGAMLLFPEFFKVGVAGAGNHDNRGYTYYWGEKWQGPLERYPDGTDRYTNQANHLLAENLEGKLLLSYGTMDDNVHPNMTLLLIDELIRHNKDFDLIVMPNRGHGYANEPYKIRRTWDYFVSHLLGAEPPREYEIRRNGEE